MNSLEFSIPKPCEASWGEMTQESNGRFCGTCQKTVVDFSVMSDEEVKSYFKSVGKASVCGRFSTAQLSQQNKSGVAASKLLDFKSKSLLPLNKVLASLTLIVSSILFSCESHTKGEVLVADTNRTVLDTLVHEEKQQPDSSAETIKSGPHMLGEVKAIH